MSGLSLPLSPDQRWKTAPRWGRIVRTVRAWFGHWRVGAAPRVTPPPLPTTGTAVTWADPARAARSGIGRIEKYVTVPHRDERGRPTGASTQFMVIAWSPQRRSVIEWPGPAGDPARICVIDGEAAR